MFPVYCSWFRALPLPVWPPSLKRGMARVDGCDSRLRDWVCLRPSTGKKTQLHTWGGETEPTYDEILGQLRKNWVRRKSFVFIDKQHWQVIGSYYYVVVNLHVICFNCLWLCDWRTIAAWIHLHSYNVSKFNGNKRPIVCSTLRYRSF